MPWKDKTVEKLREEFVAAAHDTTNFSRLCREFDISRPTGYKWLARAGETGTGSLSDLSHRPHNVPGRTAPEIERLILKVRTENPGWGGKTIIRVLQNAGFTGLPCAKTANNILKRYGCIDEEESQKRTPWKRFQRELCNELWQVDFKGEFLLGDGSRCFPLDILDDCSRFSIGIFAKPDTRGVRQDFKHAFREYGLPDAILSDNGAQFAGFRGGYTQFERWLMDLDVRPLHGRIMHPQTQGKIERFHRTMNNELLKHRRFSDLADVAQSLKEWRQKYNEIRPHEAIGMRCPAEIYTRSSREYPERILPYEYSGAYRLVKVNNWGYLRFDKIQIYLSETMADTYLEIRPMDADIFAVCYRNYQIAEIDAYAHRRINRHISRLP